MVNTTNKSNTLEHVVSVCGNKSAEQCIVLNAVLDVTVLTLSVLEPAYANRLYPGQPPSNSAAGLYPTCLLLRVSFLIKFKQTLKVLKSRRQ